MNLIKLIVKNSFAHKNTTVDFSSGINYLIGKNESGKSELLEMITYAFYGTSALRSSSKEYKDLSVILTFKIRDTVYTVSREDKDTLYKWSDYGTPKSSVEEIATTKTAVTKHISELLGYGLDIYNKLNFSKQLDSTLHSNSTKAARIDLLNKINGIDEAQLIESFLDKQRKELVSELKGLELNKDSIRTIAEYEEDEYFEQCIAEDKRFDKEADSLRDRKEYLGSLLREYDRLQTYTASLSFIDDQNLVNQYSKIRLDSCVDGSVFHDLKTYVDYHQIIYERTIDAKDRVLSLEAYKSKYSVYSKLNPSELITQEEVDKEESIRENNKLFNKKKDLLNKGIISCPHCSSSFPLMHESLKDLDSIEYVEPSYSDAEFKKAKEFVQVHLNTILNNEAELQSLKDKHEKILKDNTLKTELDRHRKLLEQFNKAQSNLAEYQLMLKTFINTYTQEVYDNIQEYRQEYNELDDVITTLMDWNAKYISYQHKRNMYKTIESSRQILIDTVEEKKSLLKDIETLLKKSKDIKLSIQNSCIPVLNKKASYIINKLTGGEHYSLTVTDTFELLLDGKAISSFSGSAQVTANVAYRIAMIEVFFKNRFPVFIGDEIDSFADETRAQHIHNSLHTLADEGYQVILVSHHSLSFEGNVIDLNELKSS